MIAAHIQGMGFDPSNQHLIVILEADSGLVLPVLIGALETQNIMVHLSGEKPPRPLMPDLFVNSLDLMGAKVLRLEIIELRDSIFFGRLVVEQRGFEYEIDCRPSDGLALAIRSNADILIAEQVLKEAGIEASNIQELNPTVQNPQA